MTTEIIFTDAKLATKFALANKVVSSLLGRHTETGKIAVLATVKFRSLSEFKRIHKIQPTKRTQFKPY